MTELLYYVRWNVGRGAWVAEGRSAARDGKAPPVMELPLPQTLSAEATDGSISRAAFVALTSAGARRPRVIILRPRRSAAA